MTSNSLCFPGQDFDDDADRFADQCFNTDDTLDDFGGVTIPNLENSPLIKTERAHTPDIQPAEESGNSGTERSNEKEKKKKSASKKPPKKERNKLAASKYRKRKKEYIEGLEAENGAKDKKIEELKASNQYLAHQNLFLHQQIHFLKSVLCFRGSGASCTKRFKTSAIVGGLGSLVMCITLSLAVLMNHPASTQTRVHEDRFNVELGNGPKSTSFSAMEIDGRISEKKNGIALHSFDLHSESNGDVNDPKNATLKLDTAKFENEINLELALKRLNLDPTLLEKMQHEDIVRLEKRANFILSQNINVTTAAIRYDEILNLSNNDFCKRLGCSEQAIDKLSAMSP